MTQEEQYKSCDWLHQESCCPETLNDCKGDNCDKNHNESCSIKLFIESNKDRGVHIVFDSYHFDDCSYGAFDGVDYYIKDCECFIDEWVARKYK